MSGSIDGIEIKMFKLIFLMIFCGVQSFIELDNPIVFYDLQTKEPLQPPNIKVLPDSKNDSFNMSSVINIRLPFIGQPCEFLSCLSVIMSKRLFDCSGACASLNCGCCAGMSIETFNFNQRSEFQFQLFCDFFLLFYSPSSVHEFHLRSNGVCD